MGFLLNNIAGGVINWNGSGCSKRSCGRTLFFLFGNTWFVFNMKEGVHRYPLSVSFQCTRPGVIKLDITTETAPSLEFNECLSLAGSCFVCHTTGARALLHCLTSKRSIINDLILIWPIRVRLEWLSCAHLMHNF